MPEMTNADPDSAIRVRGLVKRYGAKTAVSSLDLDVRQGEIFALLGPNGAGKTTTVEILEGHRDRDAGEVSVLGGDPARGNRAWRARIGIVLQGTADAQELTVAEMVGHFARYYPNPRDPDEVIASVGLEQSRKVRAKALSGGQRRRLDVALGVIGRPELLFLDEPTTGFDPEARRQFWKLIAGLRTDGTTVLLTTHYLDEAEHLADRLAVIAEGQLKVVDTPASLGGRAAMAATVSWLGPSGPEAVRTTEPTRLLADLMANHDGEVPGIEIRRPTLEDVYLQLIGHAEDEELAS